MFRPPSASPPRAESDAATEAVMLELQNETSLAIAAANLCLQRSFRITADAVQSFTAARRASAGAPLRQMREGAVLVINGSLATVTDGRHQRRQPGADPVGDGGGSGRRGRGLPGRRARAIARRASSTAAARAAREDRAQLDRLAAAFAARVVQPALHAGERELRAAASGGSGACR